MKVSLELVGSERASSSSSSSSSSQWPEEGGGWARPVSERVASWASSARICAAATLARLASESSGDGWAVGCTGVGAGVGAGMAQSCGKNCCCCAKNEANEGGSAMRGGCVAVGEDVAAAGKKGMVMLRKLKGMPG